MDTTETVATAIELSGRAAPDRAARRARSRCALVAAALILGDAAAALAAGAALALGWAALSGTPVGRTALLAGPLPLPVFCVLPIFAALGLYAVYGPSPPERLRLRALGVAIYLIGCLLVTGPRRRRRSSGRSRRRGSSSCSPASTARRRCAPS